MSTADLQLSAALSATKPQGTLGPAKNTSQVAKAAEDFEAVFINEFMGAMFEGIKTDGPFGGGPGESIFRSLMIDQYSKAVPSREVRLGHRGEERVASRSGECAMSTPPLKESDTAAKERQKLRLEQLLTVSRRLSGAIAADIQALERGAFGELKTTDRKSSGYALLRARSESPEGRWRHQTGASPIGRRAEGIGGATERAPEDP